MIDGDLLSHGARKSPPIMRLPPVAVQDLGGWLDRLKNEWLSVLLTEQSAVFALRHADRGYILEKRQVRAEGPASSEGTELHEFLGVGREAGPEDPASGQAR